MTPAAPSNFDTAAPKVAVVSGSWKSPSKTRSLTDAVVGGLQRRRPIEITRIDLAEVGGEIAHLTDAANADPHLATLFAAVASADLLVVGSPIFKASYTGVFKHFFDLIDPQALVDTPVLLTATGGSLHYALAIEHQFRPLFSFFRAHTLPTTIYAVESDFENGVVVNQGVKDRIDKAVLEASSAIDRRPQRAKPSVRAAVS